jgi:hypothetical protein
MVGIVKSAPNVMYGNWKPIYPSDPHYTKPSYKPALGISGLQKVGLMLLGIIEFEWNWLLSVLIR